MRRAALFLLPLGFSLAAQAASCRASVQVTCRSTPTLEAGQATGLASCDDVFVHRVSAVTCHAEPELPPGTACGDAINAPCTSDLDCTSGAKGACTTSSEWVPCACEYRCSEDADCPQGRVCGCPQCYVASCKTDDDCPPAPGATRGYCALAYSGDLCLHHDSAFACITDADQCVRDTDCGGSDVRCVLQAGARRCVPQPQCSI